MRLRTSSLTKALQRGFILLRTGRLRGSRSPSLEGGGSAAGIGGNFDRGDYVAVQFADLMNQARGFGTPGTYDENLTNPARDTNGWPTQASRIVVAASDQMQDAPTGTYKGFYSGAGNVTGTALINCTLANIVRTGNDVTFDVVVTNSTFQVMLDFDGACTNLKVIAPGYSTSSPPVFTVEALAHYKKFKCLRTLNLQNINFIAAHTWAQRTPAAKRHGAIPAWELTFEMATEIFNAPGSSCTALWLCVPYWATTDYQTQLLTLAQSMLPAGMAVYLEYGNEIWNTFFPAFAAVYADANNTGHPDYPLLTTGAGNDYTRMKELWGLRHARLAVLGKSILGARCRPVLAGHSVNTDWTVNALSFLSQAPQVTAFGGLPSTYTHALAAAPYVQAVDQATYDACTTIAQVDAAHRSALTSGLAYWPAQLAVWRTLANTNNIVEMNAYEWGIHTSPVGAGQVPLMRDYHLSSLAHDVTLDSGNQMEAAGWNVLCYFTVGGSVHLSTNVNSLWNVRQSYIDTAPKMTALNTLMA
jgi:hypothetical protein